jgi:hypothetical protein
MISEKDRIGCSAKFTRYVTAIAVLVAIVSICGCKPPKPAASAPAGNTWTIVGYNSVAGTGMGNVLSPSGAVGDLLVVWVKWNGPGSVLTAVTGIDSANGTLRGTQVTHDTLDLYGRFATVVTTQAAAEGVQTVFSGSPAYIDVAIWRVRVTGTVAYNVTANGTGTSTATSSGPFTTATQNGIVFAALGIYGAPTVTNMLIGGNTPTTTHTLDVGNTWDYLHTAQLSSAAATATMGTSFGWVVSALALSAQ